MSGHSHWAGIKHKKEATDKKRGQAFSKLLAAVSAAAKTEPNLDSNPRLRAAVLKAREEKVPSLNIERAIKRASEAVGGLEELIFEAYGPGGAALIVAAITDNRNRTVSEVKKILSDGGGKWGESGSVRWAFEAPATPDGEWRAKFLQQLSPSDKKALSLLVGALENHDDVQGVFANAA